MEISKLKTLTTPNLNDVLPILDINGGISGKPILRKATLSSLLALAEGNSSGFEVPTLIKTVADSGDYFIGVDTNGLLYKITKADLLAGLSSGGISSGGSSQPTSFAVMPEDLILVSGVAQTLSSSGAYTTTGRVAFQDPSAINDSRKFTRSLSAGNYTLTILTNTGSQFGKVKLEIDGVLAFDDVDLYAGGISLNVPVGRTISINSSGSHEFKFTVYGRNANASDYYFSVQQITATKL